MNQGYISLERHDFRKKLGITLEEMAVFYEILRFARHDLYYSEGTIKIADTIGISNEKVKDAIKKLIEIGIVYYYRNGFCVSQSMMDFDNGVHLINFIEQGISELVKNKNRDTKNFTYVMKDEYTALYKIGRSNNPDFREKTLLSQCPNIKLLFSFLSSYAIEKELHEKFKNKRQRGEWFMLDNNDLDYIKEIGGLK
jgi:DNA-binding Lrp family transcriptional regulator